MNDLIQHGGKMYRLADLAHYMDDGQRELVHTYAAPCEAQAFWDEFRRRYPEDADHLAGITPPAAPAEASP